MEKVQEYLPEVLKLAEIMADLKSFLKKKMNKRSFKKFGILPMIFPKIFVYQIQIARPRRACWAEIFSVKMFGSVPKSRDLSRTPRFWG